MRSPRDSIDREDKESQDRTLGYANTLKVEDRLNRQQETEKEKVASKIGKSAICAACQDNRGEGHFTGPNTPESLIKTSVRYMKKKKIWLPPKRRRGRALPPSGACCGDEDLFSWGRRKMKYHQGRISVNVHSDPNLHFRERKQNQKIKWFAQ